MSRAANCGLDQQLYPRDFHRNEVATNLATSFVLLTLVFYLWNIVSLIRQVAGAGTNHQRQRRHERSDLTINPLSALLAAAFGIVIIFATWPQPLEGAALLITVLAQVSVLGWQDHDPERFFKDLVEKIPDVLAVVVAAYALGDGRQKYLEQNPDNSFSHFHDPKNQMIIAYTFAGAGAIVGVAQEILVSITNSNASKKRALTCCSFIFAVIQVAMAIAAIVFGSTTVADGCRVFNITKICAMVTLCIGVIYSLTMWAMRVNLLPVAYRHRHQGQLLAGNP